ncbi:LamG domain-containing protein [Zoogloea sp.]|uniref:LamG domain-containing protein n=1 Tax=Zoogloea sp. TaxID=49181 RepID=UPI0014167A04|nr:MAG: LamG domain-containing protein [Zoogloea sp.]
MPKDVNKILKGATDVVLAAVDESGAAAPAQVGDTFPLLSMEFVDQDSIQSEEKKLTQKEGGGNLLQLGSIASVTMKSLSGAGAAVDAAKKFKNARCNIYGFGPQQSHKLTGFMMNLETPLEGKKDGKEMLVFTTEKKVSPDETLGTIGQTAAYFAADAAYRYNQIIRMIRQEHLVFAALPYLGNFGQSGKLYDASDARVTGSLYNGPVWGTAPDGVSSKLLFDGVNDYADFGDILDDDGVSDVVYEFWMKSIAADGTLQRLFAKKTSFGASAGIWVCRSVSNKIEVYIGDGTNSVAIASTANILQNIWNHVVIAIDRNGTMTIYINGVASGTSTSIAGVASGANALSFFIGRDGGGAMGNYELGAFRVYNFGAGGLPSDIVSIAARHYTAEKAIFGL